MLLTEAEIKLNSIDKNNAPIPGRNKGGRGQWVEKQLGLDLGSELLDFDDGEGKTFKDFSHLVAQSLIGNKQNIKALKKLINSLNSLRKESYLKTVEAFVSMDNLDSFSEIKVPSLILVGELDSLTPPTIAEEISRQIIGSRLKIVKGAGHLINIEKPAIFNKYVLNFLKDVGYESSG